MKIWIKASIASGILSLAILAGYLADVAGPALSGTPSRKTSESLPLTLLGQLRINIDDYLWLKTDDYLHFGVTHNSNSEKILTKKMIDDFSSRMGGSVEPEEESDWRGIFADLELFHPTKGNHGDPLELLPWYRVQTAVNPADTAAYINGAFFLADCAKKPEEALAFLQEGLEQNPDSLELLESIGRLHYEKWKDYDNAAKYLEQAVERGSKIDDRTEAEESALERSYLFLAGAYRDNKDFFAALQKAEEGIAACPDSRLIRALHRVILKDISRLKRWKQSSAEVNAG